jgi:hypothetical protein
MHPLSLLALTLLLTCALPQEIVDYSHTASIQKTALDSSKKYDLSISAPQLHTRLLDFPEACSRNRELFTSEIIERDRVPLGSQEEFLGQIKANMTAFLRLAERIKTHRSHLAGTLYPIQRRHLRSPQGPKLTPSPISKWRN